jgi:hypothetical protein
MNHLKTTLFVLILFSYSALAQVNINKLTPEQYFDFWVGEWELTWETASEIRTGVNIIDKILNDKIIQEYFSVTSDPNMEGFTGKSWSVYNSQSSTWTQTWVDNQGSYFLFVGEIDGDNRIFKRSIVKSDGSEILQRMVFYDIKKDSFVWNWETSTDSGVTWNLKWKIQYKRKGI